MAGSPLMFPLNLGYGPKLHFQSWKYKMPVPGVDSATMEREKGGFGCWLYAPAGLQDQLGANWGPEPVSEILAQSIQGGKDSAPGLWNTTVGIFSGAVDGGLKTVMRKGEDMMNTVFAGGKAGANAARGAITYPNELLVLQGMSFLDFNASFEMIPSNKDEANNIMTIIRGFKNSIKPTASTQSRGKFTQLEYPAVFEISLTVPRAAGRAGGRTYFRYRDMALTQVSVTYSGGANSMLVYSDGNPVQATLNLSFKSIKQVDPADTGTA